MKRWLVLWVILLCLLAGCAGDPRNQADAYATRLLADQEAADQAQEREQDEVTFAMANSVDEALQAERIAAREKLIRWTSIFGTFGICMVILATAGGYSLAALATGKALAQASMTRAGLIGLSEKTRQYPLLLHRMPDGNGLYTLTNPNNGQVLRIDLKKEPDRQMVAAMNTVQFAGVLAREGRRAQDAASISAIRPQIIDFWKGEEHELQTGG